MGRKGIAISNDIARVVGNTNEWFSHSASVDNFRRCSSGQEEAGVEWKKHSFHVITVWGPFACIASRETSKSRCVCQLVDQWNGQGEFGREPSICTAHCGILTSGRGTDVH